MQCLGEFKASFICTICTLVQRSSCMVWEISIGVCPRLDFDNIMLFNCLGYNLTIYVAFEFFMQFHC